MEPQHAKTDEHVDKKAEGGVKERELESQLFPSAFIHVLARRHEGSMLERGPCICIYIP